jgi:hypothetical protein
MGKTETINPRRDENDRGAQLRRTTMFRKVTLAFVAAASLSTAALAPGAASASPLFLPKHPHHHHHYWGHGHGFGIGFVDSGYGHCYVTRRVLTPHGFRWRTVNVCY